MIETTFDLFADYFQFYVQDEKSSSIDESLWTENAFDARIALADDAFGVLTARNMDVPVKIVVTDDSPALNLSLWDHVVEFSFHVSSGKLVVAGCTDYIPDAERISLENGCYQARVLFADLGKLSEDGLNGEDHYRVELWKGPKQPLRVIKRYPI